MQSTTDTEVILHLVAQLASATASSTASSRRCAQIEGAYSLVGADQQEADRRARPARHPPAGARRARRLPDPDVGDLRARHHRRELRARHRERRDHRRSTRTARNRTSRSRRCRRGPASSNTSISRGRIRSSAAARSMTSARPWARELAREAPVDADVVVPVPDSGVPAALGYAQAVRHSLSSSASSATTMSAAPSSSRRQQIRELGVRLKHNANRAVVAGKRIVLIDDFIVRGTTSVKIVQMMRDAGATRGAFPHRLAADHASRLLRHRHAGARQAARRHPRPRRRCATFIGADSLAFLSVDGIYRAMGDDAARPAAAAIHRPLLHRRLSDAAHRPDRAGSRRRGNCRCWRRRADAQRSESPAKPGSMIVSVRFLELRWTTGSISRAAVRSAALRKACLVSRLRRERIHDPPLASRIALVTGASRGIGYATALALAKAGAHVVAVARTDGGLEELDDEIQAAAAAPRWCRSTSRTIDGIDRLGAALHERYGKLDILVGNAGFSARCLAARPCRAEDVGRGHGGQRHRQLAADPLHGSAAEAVRRRPRRVRHLRRRGAGAAPIGAPTPPRRPRSRRWRAPMRRRPQQPTVASTCSIPARSAPACARRRSRAKIR